MNYYPPQFKQLFKREDKLKKSNSKIINMILGCIYGNALGDAFGLSTEFLTKKEISKMYGNKQISFPNFIPTYHSSRYQKGDWTDDTDQLILIMETLTEKKRASKTTFAKKLVYWINKGFPELGDFGGLGLGASTAYVCSKKNFLKDPHSASKKAFIDSGKTNAPNGAVMRTSILGCFGYSNMNQVFQNTVAMAKVTHWSPKCLASCLIVTYIIATVLQNNDKSKINTEKIIKKAVKTTKKYVGFKSGSVESKELNYFTNPRKLSELYLDEHNKIGYTYKCLGAGLYGFRYKGSFKNLMQEIAREGGDADTNGAVAGALWGIKYGYKNLPKEWLQALLHKKWLDKKVKKFLESMSLI